MKKNLIFSLFLSAFLLNLTIPKGVNSQPTVLPADTFISMDFKDASLKDILKVFSIQSGLNFIASEGVQDRQITLYLDKVPLKEAMDEIFRANNLSYEMDENASIFWVKDWGKPQVETITKVFYLKYATVSSSSLKEEMSANIKNSELGAAGSSASSSGSSGSATTSGKWAIEDDTGITKAIKKLLSPNGSIIEDFRTNSLVVTDIPSRMGVIAQTIASLDISVPQVMLEVEMLDVSKNTVDQLGVNWPTTLLSLDVPGAREINMFGKYGLGGKGRELTNADVGSWDANKFGPSILTVLGATLTLDFLRSQSDTKFLARPRLLTLNNEPAEIRIATNEAIGVTQTTSSAGGGTGTTTATAERTPTGILLRVTPQINVESGEITMFIYPKVAEATASTIQSDLGSFRDPEERSTKTLVRIKDGETVVIGGLIRNDSLHQTTSLPILSKIPILGMLFRHTGGTSSNPDKNRQRELLVFITPHIIKDTVPEPVLAKKTSGIEREQGVVSGTNRDLAIKNSLNNFENKIAKTR